jgi:hypothetical protein
MDPDGARDRRADRRVRGLRAGVRAWFSAPLVPFKQLIHPDDRAVPAVLADARRELAPVLYSPGALASCGFDDVG